MTTFFTYEEASILVRLLLAHCLTDFLLQPNRWIKEKRAKVWKSKYLWYHGLLTGAMAWVFLWNIKLWWIVLIITATHIIIDGIKLKAEKKNIAGFLLFMLDQLAHISILIIGWLWIVNGWEKMSLLLGKYLPDYRILLRVLGYVIMAGPIGFVIQFLTKKWISELNPSDSLKDAGKWIGILERILALTFVFINQFGAIGFLITAKSLLRVIDKPERPGSDPTITKPFSSRKHTEYVLIGTFLSFSIAILTGLIINWLLSL